VFGIDDRPFAGTPFGQYVLCDPPARFGDILAAADGSNVLGRAESPSPG
jgi:hypothetical protein